ncbi:hypothetical protein ACQV5M_21610, partial [Leptospira sp. SA-E8]|uniref:hypothetical protein n=1 Tax=Leptospira sp. SA-E8 TaxID=3422259 RepID=UPI003EBA055D
QQCRRMPLLLYAGPSRLVSSRGSAMFAHLAPAQFVEAHAYAQHYHEIFNELHREPVYRQLTQWLSHRLP